jgi:5-methylcytosine-specific restriction endonuclease McrA
MCPQAPRTIRHKRPKRQERRLSSNDRGYTWQWQKSRKARITMLIQRDGPYCGICKSLLPAASRDIHIDHKVAPSTKGPVGSEAYQRWFDDEDNHQCACSRCNSRKQDR